MTDYVEARAESLRRLKRAGIPSHPFLPLLDGALSRTAAEVGERVVALYCLAGMANGASGPMMLDWLRGESLLHCLDGEESRLMAQETLSEPQINTLSWNQESLYMGAWALSLVSEPTWPDAECNLDPVFPHLPPEVSPQDFLRNASLREAQEVFHEADFYYSLDASLRHDELWGGQDVKYRYPMVQIVMERRRLLDWLIQDTAWKDITLDI